MSVQHSQEQKRFIGYQNDSKKHQHHHINNGEHINGNDQRWKQVQESHNGKKKHNQAQFDQFYDGLGGVSTNHKQINNTNLQEFIPQQPTDQMKKEKRSNDRFLHLSKLLPKKALWAGYMDVGCGNAEISATIAQNLGIGNVFGIDMYSEDDFNQPCMDLEIKYIQNNDNKIRMPSNKVDLVTCFMAIHHFEHLDLILREIQRILQIDGYLFIREHDVPSSDKQLRVYIEEMHRKYPDHPADGYMKLFDRDDLREILQAYGFDHVGDSNYTGQNPQAVYHSLYVLKNKNVNTRAKQLINKTQSEELNDSLGLEKSSYSNNQNQDSISSIGDETDLNKLSLGQQSSIEYDKKQMYEQFQQIPERKSSSFDSINKQKNSPSSIEKKETQSKLNKLVENGKSGFDSIEIDNRKQNQKKYQSVQDEEEDVYANIITVLPSQKQQSKNKTQAIQNTNKPLKLNSPIKQSPQAVYEPPSPQIKAPIVDDDGFVVVCSKQTKQDKKQQQKNQSPKKSDSSNGIQQKQQYNQSEKESNQIDNNEEESNEKQKNIEEDENNSSFSNKESSNQFIYITNKKNKKRK